MRHRPVISSIGIRNKQHIKGTFKRIWELEHVRRQRHKVTGLQGMGAKSRHSGYYPSYSRLGAYNTLLQGISCLASSVPLAKGPVT